MGDTKNMHIFTNSITFNLSVKKNINILMIITYSYIVEGKTTNKFEKIIKYITLSSLICLIFAGSCTGCHSSVDVFTDILPKKKRVPTESFVQIIKYATVSKCTPVSGTTCIKGATFKSSASGSVILNDKKKGSLILTAAHVCDVSKGIDRTGMAIQELNFSIKLKSIHNEVYDAYVVFMKLDEGVDLCLIHSPSMTESKALKIANKGPELGDVYYNIAAPGGIFHPPAVPILSGHYSGYMSDIGASMYTIPAIGGSSGSPILNSRFELVGNVFAASTIYTHMTISTTYDNIILFLREALEAYSKGKREHIGKTKETSSWR